MQVSSEELRDDRAKIQRGDTRQNKRKTKTIPATSRNKEGNTTQNLE